MFLSSSVICARNVNPLSLLSKLNKKMWRLVFGSTHTKSIKYRSTPDKEEQDSFFSEKNLRRSGTEKKKYEHRHTPSRKVTFADVAGLDPVLLEVKEVVDFLKNPGKYRALGAKVPAGVLLEGPPGVGKTLIAQAVANEVGCNFFYASGSSFVEIYVGKGAARVRELFEKARAYKPSIIFIDEIDAVGATRDGLGGGSREYDQTLNELLTQMQGFENEGRIIIIAATNRIDMLDPALTRPGRFTKILSIPLPDEQARREILLHYINKLPRIDSGNIPLEYLIEKTDGFSGAELEDVVNNAALFACRQNDTIVKRHHFEQSAQDAIKTKSRRSLGDVRNIYNLPPFLLKALSRKNEEK
jgi:cell division protease FtsH